MDQLAPPVIEPASNVEPPPTHKYWKPFIWIALIFAIAGSSWLAYSNLVSAQPGDQSSPDPAIRQTLELSVTFKSLGESFGLSDTEAEFVSEETFRIVENFSKSDPEVALYQIALDLLSDQPPSQVAIQTLAKSKGKADQKLAELASRSRAPTKAELNSDDMLVRAVAQYAQTGNGMRWRKVVPQSEATLMMLGVLGFVLVLFGGCLVILLFLILKLTKLAKPVGYPQTALAADPERWVARFLLYYVSFLLISAAVVGVFTALNVPIDSTWLSTLAMLLTFATVVVILNLPIFGKGESFRQVVFRSKKNSLTRDILWGLGGFLANFPIFLLILRLLEPLQKYFPTPAHEITEMMQTADSPMSIIGLLLIAAVLAPLIEETAFRGLLFPAISQRLKSPVWGVILSSIAFGFIHPQGPMLWLALAAIGSTAAILTYHTGSLRAAMIMHGLHNATILMIGKMILHY